MSGRPRQSDSGLPRLYITVPMPRNIGNGTISHAHWSTVRTQREAYWRGLNLLVCAKQIPEPPEQPIERVRLHSVMHLASMMDHDNAVRRHKWVLDWLRRCAYIRDDSPKHLEWAHFPEQRVKRDGNYRIVLELEPLSEGV